MATVQQKTRWEKMNEVSKRVVSLRDMLVNTMPEVSSDRAVLITESYQETMGQPYIIRRAKALEKILLNMKIQIQDGELIIGSFSDKPRGGQVFPEYDMGFVIREMDEFATRTADPFFISEENKQILKQIYPYWKGNALADAALNIFSEQALEAIKEHTILLTALRSGIGHMMIDYELGINKGMLGIIQEIDNLEKRLSIDDSDYIKKRNYYNALKIVCRAAIRFAERYAELAESKAVQETEPIRKKELLTIAANCRKIPAYPAETFWEALQSFWFIHLILQLEQSGHSVSPGRFDQYMYPYFKKDLEKGVLTGEEVEELLHCLWLKFFEVNKVRDSVISLSYGGYPMFQNLMLGGQTPDGKCAVNELSHLCLEATVKVGLPQPSLSVRWFFGTSEEFFAHVMEVISYGTGMPALFNDEVLIPNMLQLGYSLEEARNYAIVGCSETTVPGNTEPWLTGGFINLPKILEITIFNGDNPQQTTNYKINTGKTNDFSTFNDFKEAFYKQIEYYLKQQIVCDNILDELHGQLCPTPFESIFIDNCMEKGKTNLEGGARYNFTTLEAVGVANVADSLAVIKKLIYEDKTISWDQLKQALLDDFLGHESLRNMILNKVPKYGNDEDYVDLLGADVLNKLYLEINKYRNARGGKYNIALYSVSSHILMGNKVGATPDGRKKGTAFADGGVSCSHGSDKSGLTALLKSVVKLDPYKATGSTLLNVKLNPEVFQGTNLSKFINIIKTYFLLKGQHIQFNVIDSQTLRDAQKHPDKYPVLTVRVAGFSVLFTQIHKELQEDIIDRMEHQVS